MVTLLETTVSGTALELPALRSPARQDVGPSGPRELSVVADMGRGVKLGTWWGVINKHAATRGGEVKGAMNNVRHMHSSNQRVSRKRFKTEINSTSTNVQLENPVIWVFSLIVMPKFLNISVSLLI